MSFITLRLLFQGACFAFLLMLSTTASALVQNSRLLSDYTHTAWTGLNGAPIDVLKFAQTTDGWLWMATPTGLFRFDGIRFERMDQVQGHALPSSNVLGLLATPDGALWVGFRFGGISMFKDKQVRHFGLAEGLPGGVVMSMTLGPDGTIWAATRDGLAFLATGEQHFKRAGPETGLPQALARQILFDRQGVQWVSVAGGIYFRQPGQQKYHQAWPKLDLMAMAEGPDGSIWASDGVYKYYKVSTQMPAGKDVARVVLTGNGMFFDRDGVMWILKTDGLERRQAPWTGPSDAGQILTVESGMSGPLPQTFFQDREGSIWTGTSSGLDRLRRNRLQILPVDLPFDHASMIGTGAGEVLIGDFAGAIRRFDASGAFQQELADGVSVAYRSSDGTIWLGNDKALLRREAAVGTHAGAAYTRIPLPPALAGNQVQAITETMDKKLWVSFSRKGLFRFDDGQWQENGGITGLPTELAMSLCTDTAGHVWVAYAGNHIAMIDGQHARLFGDADGLHLGNVLTLYVDGGLIWAGGEFGLAFFDGHSFVPVRLSDGQDLRGISGIARTAAGELWLHGADGITRIAADEVTQLLREPGRMLAFERLNALDGLHGNASQLRPLPSLIAGTDGRLWFATASEVASIDPLKIPRNAVVPSVQITALHSGGLTFAAQPSIQLPTENRDIQISFTALSLAMPERVRFRYQLQGYDKSWHEADGRRDVFYTNLPPGSYRFVVIAANEDGLWNKDGASLQLIITPSFAETPWFFALLILLAVLLLYGLYLLRVRHLTARMQELMHERLAERARIARGLHDTLLQSVQGLIIYFDQQARKLPSNSEEREKLEQTLELADQLMVEGRQHIMDLRTTSIPEELEQALKEYGQILLNERFTLELKGKPRSLCPAVRNEIYAIAREALFNAARHSNASAVKLELNYSNDSFALRVCDNGQGMALEIAQKGQREGHWGLVGMRERSEVMGASFRLQSAPDQGTEIQITMPASLAYVVPDDGA